MSHVVVTSNLDNDTMKRTLQKGEFTDYSERYLEDGIHDFPNEEESVDFNVDVGSDDISSSNSDENDPNVEVAYKTKYVKRYGEINDEDNYDAKELKKMQKMKKKKPAFTVEDQIARNFQDLLKEQEEYTRNDKGDLVKKKKAFLRIGTTSFSLGVNLANALIGAGLLSLTSTCSKMGIIGYIVWIFLTIAYFFITWNYFNRAIYLTGAATLGELLSLLFGRAIAITVDVFNTIFFFAVLMCYQVIAVQYILGIAQDVTDRDTFDFTMDECYGDPVRTVGISCYWHFVVLAIVAFCFNLPLVLPRSIKFLSRISMISIFAACLTTFSVFGKTIKAVINGSSSNGTDENIPTLDGKLWPTSFMGFFTMAPFISANFQIHSMLPPVFVGTKGMSKKTKLTSLQGGSYVSILICSTLFLFVAVSGYVSFDEPSSNILNDFSNPDSNDIDWLIVICRGMMIVVVILSYPSIMLPTSAGVIRYIPKKWKISKLWKGRFIIMLVRVCVLLVTTTMAAFFTDIGVIFSIASAVFSIFVVYICPLMVMMLWPRIKMYGEPSFRKLSIVDNIIYNKHVSGNPNFTHDDIEQAIGTGGMVEEGVKDIVVSIDSNDNEVREVKDDANVEVKNDANSSNSKNDSSANSSSSSSDIDNSNGSDDSNKPKEQINLNEPNEVKDVIVTIETDVNGEVIGKPKEIEMDNEDNKPNGGNNDAEIHEVIYEEAYKVPENRRWFQFKMPKAHIPWYRYLLYSIAMFLCVVYCLLAVIGTLAGY
ncbi:N-system amino acid transporter 1 [Entamoeba marina]